MGQHEKVTVTFDFEKVKSARESALALIGSDNIPDVNRLLDNENLDEIEKGIKNLNDFSRKAWLLSSILLYTVVYDQSLYEKSGLDWEHYISDSKKRLGMDKKEVCEQLSSAKFFIEHHVELLHLGYTPRCLESLARAQLALELSKDIHAVCQHLVTDSNKDFRDWYSSFNLPSSTLPQLPEGVRNDIVVTTKTITINGVVPCTVNDALPANEKIRLEGYLQQIYMAIKDGYEPAIVPVYDKKEAVNLIRLRDRYRQGK